MFASSWKQRFSHFLALCSHHLQEEVMNHAIPVSPVSWFCHKMVFIWKNYKRHSVQFSCSVVSNSLRPQESQHARPPCPPTPGVHSDSHPSSQWCHPAISCSVVPFSSCPQSFPASDSFPMSQVFAWGDQSTRVSALASFLPKKSQGWSPLEWTDGGTHA